MSYVDTALYKYTKTDKYTVTKGDLVFKFPYVTRVRQRVRASWRLTGAYGLLRRGRPRKRREQIIVIEGVCTKTDQTELLKLVSPLLTVDRPKSYLLETDLISGLIDAGENVIVVLESCSFEERAELYMNNEPLYRYTVTCTRIRPRSDW